MDKCENTITTNTKVPFDPGWNDPPTFTYNAQQGTPTKPRNFLNKRVAFPVSSTSGSVPIPPVNVPPTSTPLPLIPTIPSPLIPIIPSPLTNASANIEPQKNVQIDSERTLQEVKDMLLSVLENSSELGIKGDSIRKKISFMEDMWSNGKLNTQVHLKMQELTQALKEDNPKKADEIHKALMVDHVGLVGLWMPGVKQIIYNCIARTELLAIDKE